MQISSVKKEELALLINGLRAVWYQSGEEQKQQARLLKQLEGELQTRFGLVLREAA
jgi:hypothetical protein